MGNDDDGDAHWVPAAPSVCDIERPPRRNQHSCGLASLLDVLRALRRQPEGGVASLHLCCRVADGVPLEYPVDTVIHVGNEAVERH